MRRCNASPPQTQTRSVEHGSWMGTGWTCGKRWGKASKSPCPSRSDPRPAPERAGEICAAARSACSGEHSSRGRATNYKMQHLRVARAWWTEWWTQAGIDADTGAISLSAEAVVWLHELCDIAGCVANARRATAVAQTGGVGSCQESAGVSPTTLCTFSYLPGTWSYPFIAPTC